MLILSVIEWLRDIFISSTMVQLSIVLKYEGKNTQEGVKKERQYKERMN
jgi:hypothetical protein